MPGIQPEYRAFCSCEHVTQAYGLWLMSWLFYRVNSENSLKVHEIIGNSTICMLKRFTGCWLILYNLSPNYPQGIWRKSSGNQEMRF